MKKTVYLFLLPLLIAQSSCAMSPSLHKRREGGMFSVRATIESLQEAGMVDLSEDQVTFALATVVFKKLPTQPLRDSLDQALSEDDLEQRRKDAIRDLITTQKDELLKQADELTEKLKRDHAAVASTGAGNPTGD